ncbi:hypothetical protein TL5118_00245 [Thalassovita autumnalis]|uniref:DUF1800 domain-containing protein n=1 Tax=Thalassovita autumnalis TaxID=2072972 RepID=A0A0P1F5C0_9RHOB|nr:DUF1800 domain-containing protein [Thalassovita autumnalis]CUH62931.1 hypothetical protein TL5118_00245 [Thalassovita autumnalis]CUH72150.1 hypothetical protein TL5120_01946 [Thalassovita autumnalis]
MAVSGPVDGQTARHLQLGLEQDRTGLAALRTLGMTFDPILAEKRFGYGLSPRPELAPPHSVAEMLARLRSADRMLVTFPVDGFDRVQKRAATAQKIQRQIRQARSAAQKAAADKRLKTLFKAGRQAERAWLWSVMMRRVWTRDAFRERLVAFWGDHFTARGKNGAVKRAAAAYVDTAIRPYLLGRFEDLLIAAVTHPLMLHYLDQIQSTGPNSLKARRKNGQLGLNENLAREVLELHTLGVEGTYSQRDVRQLAELLTGLTATPQKGRVFRAELAEPGAEEVLGQLYGGGRARLRDIHAVLKDLARHPATARHIAQKLAVHFISDTPPADLITALERAYLDSKGNLPTLYEVLLNHPAAMDPVLHNIRLPDEFVAAAMRALAVSPDRYYQLKRGRPREQFIVQLFQRPMEIMGQPWLSPLGPDGWEEGDANWLTPQGLTSRLHWALKAPERLTDALPDPRILVTEALGAEAPPAVRFAASAAEDRREGVALVLASPAFQRK